MKVVIPREKWLRGPYANDSSRRNISLLLDPETGMRCCVGHILSAYGVPDHEMALIASASDVQGLESFSEANWLIDVTNEGMSSCEAEDLYEINDSLEKVDEEREQRIKEICSEYGLSIEFTGPRLPKVGREEVRYEDGGTS